MVFPLMIVPVLFSQTSLRRAGDMDLILMDIHSLSGLNGTNAYAVAA